MTDTSSAMPKAPLGVGKIISESFSILFSNFVKVLILGFLATFAGFLVNGLISGFDAAAGIPDPTSAGDATQMAAGSIVSVIVNVLSYALVTAMLIQLAYDAKLGRKGSIGDYISGALPALFPIVVLSIVVSILSGIGALALIIGALWVYAVFYVFAPAAVIEGTGFGSLGRSAGLTKEYRWPIVGLFLVMFIIVFILQLVVGGAIAAVLFASVDTLTTLENGISTGSIIIFGLIVSLIYGLAYGLSGIAVALVYARLREIKEGVAVDQIASVFE
ncbi:MAG: hypothetical protein MK180_13235 [Rhodobacteraceae bacterium]|nr:hypothetical protein [Paracoccaceae bacterium]